MCAHQAEELVYHEKGANKPGVNREGIREERSEWREEWDGRLRQVGECRSKDPRMQMKKRDVHEVVAEKESREQHHELRPGNEEGIWEDEKLQGCQRNGERQGQQEVCSHHRGTAQHEEGRQFCLKGPVGGTFTLHRSEKVEHR